MTRKWFFYDLQPSVAGLLVRGSSEEVVYWLTGDGRDQRQLLCLGAIDQVELRGTTLAFKNLQRFLQHDDWSFGYFAYDLKNEVEELSSANRDVMNMPLLHFVQPKLLIKWHKGQCEVGYHEEFMTREAAVQEIEAALQSTGWEQAEHLPVLLKERVSKGEYLNAVKALQSHIQAGDIYEVNYCQEFFAEGVSLDALSVFEALTEATRAPFACFVKNKGQYLMSASPERFLRKEGTKLISQPIKGTIRRGASLEEDETLKAQLYNDPKERGENVMIVDLVRNDLSRSAIKGSVKVPELFGIYTFETVHQMISTVEAELREDVHWVDALKACFPMGSMTGAPKVRAMQLIEYYEQTKRGLYSGAVGYVTPDEDFDFNVVIRSLQYDAATNYLSLMVGGAITAKSDPEQEYEECLLKAHAIRQVLANSDSVLS